MAKVPMMRCDVMFRVRAKESKHPVDLAITHK